MGAFEYTALDAQGRERKGLIEGDTPKHVRQLLRDKQLLPMDIQETAQTELKKSRARGFMRRGLSTLDLALLTRQLATLLRSGPAARGIAAGGRRADRKAARAAHHPGRAQQGGRGPSPGRRFAGFSAGVPRDLSGDGVRRRAVRQARLRCSSGCPTTPNRARSWASRSATRWCTPSCCWCCPSPSCPSCWPTWCRRWSRCSNPATRNCRSPPASSSA